MLENVEFTDTLPMTSHNRRSGDVTAESGSSDHRQRSSDDDGDSTPRDVTTMRYQADADRDVAPAAAAAGKKFARFR